MRGPELSRKHHRRTAASARRPLAAAGTQGPPGEPPRGSNRLGASAGEADRGVPRRGDPAGRVRTKTAGSGAQRRGAGRPGATAAGAGPPTHGARWRGWLRRGFLRASAQWPRQRHLRAETQVGGTTDRSGDRYRRGSRDTLRDPDQSRERARSFLSFAFRLSPPPSASEGSRRPGGSAVCQGPSRALP